MGSLWLSVGGYCLSLWEDAAAGYQEATGHVVATVRKQREVSLACFLLL